jgi:hypothetical protein
MIGQVGLGVLPVFVCLVRDHSLHLGDLALQLEHFGLAHIPALQQRQIDVEFCLDQFQRLPQRVHFLMNRGLPRLEQHFLVGAYPRILVEFRRELRLAPIDFRREARYGRIECGRLGAAFKVRRFSFGLIEADQGLAMLNERSFLDQNILNDAAIEFLDHLVAGTRDNLPRGAGNLIDFRPHGP